MRIEFTKMNGAGNDFVVIADIDRTLHLSAEQIARVCDRRKGVGADGLIVIQSDLRLDFHMSFYNSDGQPAEMCGNGSRCSARFAAGLGLGSGPNAERRLRFSTDSGPIEALVTGDRVRMTMMDAGHMRRGISVDVAGRREIVHFMVVGTRHVVMFVNDVDALTGEDIVNYGRTLRHAAAFAPKGVNVNFASVDAAGVVHLRTYEKGVEAETHACGTGSVVASVLLAQDRRLSSPVTVVQKSGDVLVVSFELVSTGATRVTLEGQAAINFQGSLEV